MKIFIVEDDPFYQNLLEYNLSMNPDFELEKFSSAKDCINNLYKNPDVVTLDFSLPDMTGIEALRKIKCEQPQLPVVIISAQEDITTAISLIHEGAYDYLVKNEETRNRLWNTLKNLKEKITIQKDLDYLKAEVTKKYDFSKNILGSCDKIKRVFSLLEKAATSTITVSISGETGTGKELAAKAIHYNSSRSHKPFIALNVAAIPKELIESELFGHEKGAFTGALNRRIGKFEEANGGTLFLDEIGEMDLNMQTKLLRVLQEREFTRIGGTGVIKTDVRIIIATHRNLMDEVRKGNFREDLFYRVIGLPIELPALRERGNDILLLAKHFMQEACKENKVSKKQFSKEAQQKLLQHKFSGNIRELKAIVELAVILCDGDEIRAENIQFNQSLQSPMQMIEEEITLKEYTNKIVRYYLHKYNDDVMLVAEKLDIGKSTIYRMLQNQELNSQIEN
jgi:DNA-binding NtrC family response regulator